MEWISVKEKLPDDYVDVVIFCYDVLPHVMRTASYSSKHKSWYKHAFSLPDEIITHWMLPEPPKP